MAEAIVEFNYKAEQPDELTLSKGDIIQGIVQQEGGWWTGVLNGRKGVFPDNFVRVLETKDRRRCQVLFSYTPLNSDELELQVDQEIEVLDEVEEGWWKGKLGDKVGVFPSNFVKVIPEPKKNDVGVKPEAKQEKKSPKPSHKVMSKSIERETCRVTFAYNAVNNDELNLQVGDIVSIISKDTQEKGWWKGEINGKVGVFPDNFVEIVKTDSAPPLRKKSSESKRKIPEPTIEDKSPASAKTPPLLPKKPKAPPPQETPHSIVPEVKKTDRRTAPEPKISIPEAKISPPPQIAAPTPASKILSPPLEPKSTPPAAAESKLPSLDKLRVSNDFDSVPRGDMLVQPERPKAPRRRPPSTVLKQNGHSEGNEDEEDSADGPSEDIKVSIEMKPRVDKPEEVLPHKIEMKKSPFMEELKGAFNQTKKDKPPPAKPRPVSFGLSISAPMTSPRKSPTTDELKTQAKPMPEKRPPSIELAKPEPPPKVELPKPEVSKPEVPKEAVKPVMAKLDEPKKVSLKPLTLEERVKELEESVKKLAAALRDETRNRLRLEEEVERLSNRVVQI